MVALVRGGVSYERGTPVFAAAAGADSSLPPFASGLPNARCPLIGNNELVVVRTLCDFLIRENMF